MTCEGSLSLTHSLSLGSEGSPLSLSLSLFSLSLSLDSEGSHQVLNPLAVEEGSVGCLTIAAPPPPQDTPSIRFPGPQ